MFRSDLLTGHEPSRTRDDDEDEDEKRGQLPPVPHPAARIPYSKGHLSVVILRDLGYQSALLIVVA